MLLELLMCIQVDSEIGRSSTPPTTTPRKRAPRTLLPLRLSRRERLKGTLSPACVRARAPCVGPTQTSAFSEKKSVSPVSPFRFTLPLSAHTTLDPALTIQFDPPPTAIQSPCTCSSPPCERSPGPRRKLPLLFFSRAHTQILLQMHHLLFATARSGHHPYYNIPSCLSLAIGNWQ
jgi:hypothetical protein